MKKILLSSIAFLFIVALSAQDCANLFFSEYVEGAANNKTLEIYNPTNNPVDLGSYLIKRYSNGSPFPTEELALSGTLQPKDVVVVTNGQTDSLWVSNGGYWSLPIWEELYNLGDLHCSGIYPTPMYFNGNDAMTLETITGGVIDIFGKIGADPGANGWNDIPPGYTAGTQFWTSWSVDQTLIRKPSVKAGVTTNPALFMVNAEWDSIPENTFDSLGFHRCDCGVMGVPDIPGNAHSLVIYPNPVTGGTLYLNASSEILKAEILTVTGQVVKLANMPARTTQGKIDMNGIPEGIYLLRVVFADEQPVIQKIIKR